MKVYLIWECVKANSYHGFRKTLVKLFLNQDLALAFNDALQQEDQWRE